MLYRKRLLLFSATDLLLVVGALLAVFYGYRYLERVRYEDAWAIAAGGAVAVGVLSALATRVFKVNRWHGLGVAVALSAIAAYIAIIWFPYYGVPTHRPRPPVLDVDPPVIWAFSLALCHFLVSLALPGEYEEEEYTATDEEVLEYAREHGLLLPKEEVEALRERPAGLECPFCFADYSDQTEDLLHQWMRCPRNPEHVYHVWHFRDMDWRCPLCRHPLMSDDE